MKLWLEEGKDNCVIAKVELPLLDEDSGDKATLTGSCRISKAQFSSLMSSEQEARQIATHIVGRLLTQWKLSMIGEVSDGVTEAVRAYMAEQMRGIQEQ